MLSSLRVRDLVLIDELDLVLSPTFNVLTGETGAGKSLVATAVDLLLGRRGSQELVRRGREEAEVEGLFDISDEPDIKGRLFEAGLPVDDELLIRRVIPAKGKHKCYVNGRLSSLGVLSQLAEGLAKMTSQHEQHSLSDPASRLSLLDGFGKLSPITDDMSRLFDELEEARAALDALNSRERDRASRLDYLKFQSEEIDRVSPQPSELADIETELSKLKALDLLKSVTSQAQEVLYDGDEAVFEKLSSMSSALKDAAQRDETLLTSAETLADAAASVEDIARFLSKYERSLEADPDKLAELDERRETLSLLCRKHGTDIDGLIAMKAEFAEEIATLEGFEEARGEAEKKLAHCQERAHTVATKLSKERKKTGKTLAAAVIKELGDLMFAKAGFEVEIDSERPLSRTGKDMVEFLAALNPGEGAHPIQKTASGGELSRLMLAVKRALAGVGPVGTYIFDEVDAGIGGPTASAVGRKLKEVSLCHQVICITHLPQIAGMADAHFFVSKKQEQGRTATAISRLNDAERVEELSRMLGGDKVTDKTRAAARELLAAP
jgi:DNA repair protein RecN (Recombination protein N)